LQPRRLYEAQGRSEDYDAIVERLKTERVEHLQQFTQLSEEIIKAVGGGTSEAGRDHSEPGRDAPAGLRLTGRDGRAPAARHYRGERPRPARGPQRRDVPRPVLAERSVHRPGPGLVADDPGMVGVPRPVVPGVGSDP